MNETDLFLLALCLPLLTILVVFGMRYVTLILQARAHLANDDAYRLLAAKTTLAQSDTATGLSSVQALLGDVRTRLHAIEKILKEVE